MAGALLVPVSLFTPHIGQNVIIKGFVVVVIGGMGSVLGATAAGLALGILEALGSIYIPAGFNLALIYATLLAILLIRPQGLVLSQPPTVNRRNRCCSGPPLRSSPWPCPSVRRTTAASLSQRPCLPCWRSASISCLAALGYISFGHAAFFGLGAYARPS